ncbi:hypothetical protein PBI_COUNT_61 [Microbacterium phage Count]|nr:hypothetical protein PBI_COUNT_61 [Microbacterium phage Count]
MYNNNSTVLAATGGGFLAGANGIWWLLAGFALIAAGSALMRIIPRRTEEKS